MIKLLKLLRHKVAPTSELLKMMAKHITEHAPKGTDTKSWNY